MKPEIKQKWIAALKSGEYKQGKNALQNMRGEFCCLGVLCDLAIKKGVIPEPTAWGYNKKNYNGDFDYLPTLVYKWAELGSPDPSCSSPATGIPTRLSEMNDAGVDFNKIADIIEGCL